MGTPKAIALFLISTAILAVDGAAITGAGSSNGHEPDAYPAKTVYIGHKIHPEARPSKRQASEYHEEHQQFEADEFLFREKFDSVEMTIDAGVSYFNGTNLYCTTWWKNDDKEDHGDYSQASMWCKAGYSVELWSKRTEKDQLPDQNVRIFCHGALVIAQEALSAVRNGSTVLVLDNLVPPDPPGRFNQRWLTSSSWTGDQNWGVGIVYLEDGCPDLKNKVATATFSYEGKPADRLDRSKWDSLVPEIPKVVRTGNVTRFVGDKVGA
ncbi:hypothetical protein Dda_2439 [Drechslerella dactyloides]|uniref:Uncharacterized protein n=1 Tax=Drechslerella dactyloides TaxID=74499 RepID=A0AAD6NJB6_DREDA|nr:hypothetical protein Dda_2439 [Drechslerella dactyloides]